MAAGAAVEVDGVSVEFEVFGKVQRVYFRKSTKEKADALSISGWVKNTAGGTVVGCIVGPHASVDKMKTWLSSVGSEKSEIDKAVFQDPQPVDLQAEAKFIIRRKKKTTKATKK